MVVCRVVTVEQRLVAALDHELGDIHIYSAVIVTYFTDACSEMLWFVRLARIVLLCRQW